MRAAAARAAIRRGSSMMSFVPATHGSSSRASGTRVVLPAPGGACKTAAVDAASADRTSFRTSSIGSGALLCAILRDAARDELLQQLGLALAVFGAAHVRQRIPQILHDHEQLLGVDLLVARLRGR